MAYIIAHGTVNGYCKIPSPQSIGIEQNVLTDIRAQFDNTPTMLQKPVGYLIQMASNGVWISVVKLLFDGERSGGGAGFFAFSAFVSANQYVQGSALRNLLDDLMNTYLSKTSGTSTKNIGVDWSFVNDATAKLNELCIPRTKPINTHYLPSDKFAYVGISDNDIDKYLEKPFQPEYGQYKAVFLGTHLQHPSLLSSQTPLSIDLENEEYTIEWHGDNVLWKNLPTTVRKKEIEHGNYPFKKQYYEDQTVYYRDGKRDDVNNIIILTIPQLKPIVYKLEAVYYDVMGTLFYKTSDSEVECIVPEGVISLSARTSGVQDPRKSPDKKTIEFYGEQVAMTWTLKIETNKNYKSVQVEIRPIDFRKNVSDTQWQYPIRLEKLKTILVKIYQDCSPKTSDSREIVTFYNKKTGQAESGSYDSQTKNLQFYIPENREFLEIYGVCVKDRFKDKWNVFIETSPPNTFEVKLSRKQEPPKVPSTNRIIHIYVYDEKIGKEGILLVSDNNGRNIQCNLRCVNGTTYSGDIQVSNTVHRSELSIKTENGKPLHFETKYSDVIEINDETIFCRLWNWVCRQWRVLLVIVVAIIAIGAGGFLLYKHFFPQKTKYPTVENGVRVGLTDNSESNIEVPSYSNGLPNFCQFCYLDSVYQVQCSKWNQAEIGKLMDSINGDLAIKLREQDSVAYVRYKQIAWLQVRGKVNKADWNHITDYVREGNAKYDGIWKNYANDSIRLFLSNVIAPGNGAKRKKFATQIKADSTFADKTFNEVKEIWSNCSTKSSQTEQSTQGGQKKNNNNRENSKPKNNNRGMESAGDF